MLLFRHMLMLMICWTGINTSIVNATVSPKDEALYIEKMRLIFEAMPKANIWPGCDVHLTPTLLHFSNHHTYALQFTPTNPDWKNISHSSAPIYFLEQDEYHLDPIPLSYGISIDNQMAYVYQYIDAAPYPERNIFVALHERFHAFQFQSEPFKSFQFNTYPDLNNIENMALSYLELSVLKEYWLHQDLEALKDYVAITLFQEKKLQQASVSYEIAKEVFEGLANYFTINAMLDEPSRKRDILQSDLNASCPETFEGSIDCQRQRRYYYTGAISAMALDALKPNWKSVFIEKHLAPRVQLQTFFHLTPNEITARVQAAKQRYDFELLLASLKQTTQSYVDALTKHLQQYQQSTDATIELFSGFTHGKMGSGSALESYYINGESRLQIDYTSTMLSADKHWILKTNHLPYMIESSDFIQTKIDPQTAVVLDNEPITINTLLHSFRTRRFSSLTMITPTFELYLTQLPGQVTVSDGKIQIRPVYSQS